MHKMIAVEKIVKIPKRSMQGHTGKHKSGSENRRIGEIWARASIGISLGKNR